MPENLYTFTAISAWEIPAPGDGEVTLTVDESAGALVVVGANEDPISFALVDDEDEPLPRGLVIETVGTTPTLRLGTVTFARTGLLVEHFALNDMEISFAVSRDGGYIGILDVRDIGRAMHIHYYFDIMPIALSIEGNYLVVKTLSRISTDTLEPWYEVV